MSAIKLLRSQGQSIWVDYLSREMLVDGTNSPSATTSTDKFSSKLDDLIASGVRGLTTNPSIFKAAIADTENYDSAIQFLAKQGNSAQEIVTTLMIQDVADAARALIPIYEQSGHRDGFASIEVSPLLAHSSEDTIKEAVALWERIGLPNVMIKIPATKAGLPAIREVLAHGINVNVTLIFAPTRYQEVLEQFVSGITDRHKRSKSTGSSTEVAGGLPSQSIASVASFFVSRLDALVEKLAGQEFVSLSSLFGKVAIANCRKAYAYFERRMSDDDIKNLVSQGIAMQRPLWASTGVKNPKLGELYYVTNLVAPNTVNTLPLATLNALMFNADTSSFSISPLVSFAESEADNILTLIEGKGVNLRLDELFFELECQGVSSFVDSYKALVDSVETVINATLINE
jgi:transaldolase